MGMLDVLGLDGKSGGTWECHNDMMGYEGYFEVKINLMSDGAVYRIKSNYRFLLNWGPSYPTTPNYSQLRALRIKLDGHHFASDSSIINDQPPQF